MSTPNTNPYRALTIHPDTFPATLPGNPYARGLYQTSFVVEVTPSANIPDAVRFVTSSGLNITVSVAQATTLGNGQWDLMTSISLYPFVLPGTVEISALDTHNGLESNSLQGLLP